MSFLTAGPGHQVHVSCHIYGFVRRIFPWVFSEQIFMVEIPLKLCGTRQQLTMGGTRSGRPSKPETASGTTTSSYPLCIILFSPSILSLPSVLIWFYLRRGLGVQGIPDSLGIACVNKGKRFWSQISWQCHHNVLYFNAQQSLRTKQWFWPKLLAEVVCTGLLEDHVTKVWIKTWLWVHVILSSHGTNSISIRLVSFSLFLITWKCKSKFRLTTMRSSIK
jgi:hypothetical protein